MSLAASNSNQWFGKCNLAIYFFKKKTEPARVGVILSRVKTFVH